MNNETGFCTGYIPEGFLLGPEDKRALERDFSLASMLTMVFYIHSGMFAEIKSVADFKKAFSEFNDFIQQMDIPELEVNKDEV